MNSLRDTIAQPQTATDGHAVLASEAGVPFHVAVSSDTGVDPIAQWLSLMEVVQMLCPVWPVREHGMQGDHWRL